MMYPYVTLSDDTEITHSEMLSDGRVKVYIETPDLKDGFHNATCYLPDYTWENINGYSDTEMDYFKEFIRNNAHLLIQFSKEGYISGTLLCNNNSHIPQKTLNNIMRYLEANSSIIINKWYRQFGEIRYFC